MSALRFIEDLGNTFLGFFFKLFIYLIAIVMILGISVALVINWPFTIALIVGLVLSEEFYKRFSKHFHIKLPEHFKMNISDLFLTFHEGDEYFEVQIQDQQQKLSDARRQLTEMKEAVLSSKNQLEELKTKRSLGKLFKKPKIEIDSRMATAIELQVDKPRWASKLDEMHRQDTDWEAFMA